MVFLGLVFASSAFSRLKLLVPSVVPVALTSVAFLTAYYESVNVRDPHT